MKAKTRPPVEPGAASIKIELTKGSIFVTHGECGAVLAVLRDAPVGTWDKLWDAMNVLGIKGQS